MNVQINPDALHAAVRRCDIPAIKELLARGYDPSAVDPGGMTPLHCAVYGGYLEAATQSRGGPKHPLRGYDSALARGRRFRVAGNGSSISCLRCNKVGGCERVSSTLA